MFRKILIFAAIMSIVSSASAYYIKNFKTDIFLFTDGSYRVEERIIVDFGGENRHGIYRNIPYKYKTTFRKKKVRISDIEVTDEEGNSRKKRVKREGDYIKIRIGSPDITVTGTHVYVIKYHVENAILFFDNYDELYWNVTGTEWECDILSASATVYLPSGMPNNELKMTCFTGPYGSEESNCSSKIENNTVRFRSTRPLGTFEGLSIGLSMPKGYIKGPSLSKRVFWILIVIWPLFLLPIGLLWLGAIYIKRGRDPIRLSIAPRYEPPEDLVPAEAGTLIDERVDMRDMTSTIVDLAVRGYLKIVEIERTKLVFFSTKDYVLVKLKDNDSGLKKHERLIYKGLFDKGSIKTEEIAKAIDRCPECADKKLITVSSLKEAFYVEIPKIKKAIYKSLVDMKMFPSDPEKVRSKYLGWGIFWALLGFSFGFFLNILLIPVLIILGVVTIIVGRYMPRKTRLGSTKAAHVAGFEEFVRRVEKDRIERMAKDDPTVFERLLPYAMALGVADQWADAFSDIFKEAPDWFVGQRGVAFMPYVFVNSLGSAVNSVGSAMTSRPRSSGAGGGSSSFSGGGFSGGGFGGGGGGAW